MHSPISILGTFRILDIPEDRYFTPAEVDLGLAKGHIRLVHVCRNLVVNNGLRAIATILGGGAGSPTVGGLGVTSAADLVIDRMELGNAVAPPAPVITDTTSVTSLAYVPAVLVAYPALGSIRFSGVVRHSDLNGTTFTEEALKMANGQVFAKVSGFAVLKQGNSAKMFEHQFDFARV